MVLSKRSSGILLHPTSLPSEHGIGDLGAGAYRFVDYLVQAKQRYWQVLPLNPTGFGNSPYSSTSAFAGNPLLIDLTLVCEETKCLSECTPAPEFSDDSVDYERVAAWKLPRLRRTATCFLETASHGRRESFRRFCQRHRMWLDDYALFVSIKRHFDSLASESECDNSAWNVFWDKKLAHRDPETLAKWSQDHHAEIAEEKVLQFFFFEQWARLKHYVADRGIRMIGDVPIFVALDSAEVWASPDQFLLDENLQPTEVAGVPPDYFSATGQRWGNPLYNWETMRTDGYRWWTRRIAAILEWVDVIRLDHFRGFEACWSIPANELTAINGRWSKAPGDEVFAAIRASMGEVPIIAEDLGVITPEVEALRDRNGFPGMRILQFAFDKNESRRFHFLPHHYVSNSIVYTGTHDNDTVCGWFDHQSESNRDYVRRYLNSRCDQVAWDFIRAAMASVANTVILPMQDVLELGCESRLNTPATIGNNWGWRLRKDQLAQATANRLAVMVDLFGRDPVINGHSTQIEVPAVEGAEGNGTAINGKDTAKPQVIKSPHFRSNLLPNA